MRTGRFFCLLAGTALAATVIAPSPGIAAPDRIQSAPPPPLLINGQRIIIRRTAGAPLRAPPAGAARECAVLGNRAGAAPAAAARRY